MILNGVQPRGMKSSRSVIDAGAGYAELDKELC